MTISTIAFVGVYGFCNSYASTAEVTYRVYADWELKIPLVPWMMIPYRSLDWIFIVAFFWLGKKEIARFSLHMVVGVLLAAIVFILFPGELGFVRPDPATLGFWEPVYRLLYKLDKPHNLYPSLHITYSYFGLKAIHDYNKNFKISLICLIWFISICFSVILTYQHHLIDIVLGFALGHGVYKYTFRLEPEQSSQENGEKEIDELVSNS